MSGRSLLALYFVAAAIYIGIGIAFPDFLLASVVALAFQLVVIWLVPTLIRRFR